MVKRLKDGGIFGKPRRSGKITKLLNKFGFIDSNDQEYFFHFSECRLNSEQIKKGQPVTFVLRESKKKPGQLMAAEIKPL